MALLTPLLLLGAPELPAGGLREQPPPEAELRPEDPREEWRLGISTFTGRDLPAEAEYVTQQLPLLIREELSDVDTHAYGKQERDAYRRALKNRALLEAGRAVDQAIARRDRAAAAERRGEAAAAVREATQDLRILEGMAPSSIVVPEEKPLVLLGDAGGLLPADRSPRSLVEEEDLDAVIHGVVRDLDGFIEVEVRLYSRYRERELFRETRVTRPARVYEATAELRDRLVTAVLGRPWARLTVRSPEEDASIYVDEELVGIGEAQLPRARTGLRSVRVVRPGGASVTEVVELEARGAKELDITVPTPESGEVTLRSSPSGASIYIESTWRGTTPLTVERPAQVLPFRMTLDGYNEVTGSLGPASPEMIERELVPAVVDQARLVEERRDTFYRAFAATVLSVPVPVIFNGLYQSILALFPGDGGPIPGTSDEESRRLATLGTVYFYTSRGGIFVTAGLGVNAVVQLLRYVEASQYQHTAEE